MPTPMEMGYKMVAERHAQFILDCPDNMIRTSLAYASDHLVVMKCEVWKNKPRPEGSSAFAPSDGVGHASMPIPGPTSFTKNSEVENAETSALGRALAMIGYHAKETMASEDEIAMKRTPTTTVLEDFKAAVVETSPATSTMKSKLMAWGKKVLGSEEEVRKFVYASVGKRSSKTLTRADIDTLFDGFRVLEAAGKGSTLEEIEPPVA